MAYIMKNHISNIIAKYKNDVIAWDVVNEAVKDAGSGDGDSKYLTSNDQSNDILKLYAQQDGEWVTNPWYQIGSYDNTDNYVELAFKYTRQECSDCNLFYNDYNMIQYEAKANAVYNLLSKLRNNKKFINHFTTLK